jgi:hypothetical protein
VSNGSSSSALAAFTINVVGANSGSGAATLVWSPPTVNTDGSTITDLGGYRIYYGTTAAALTQVAEVRNPGITSYVVDHLVSGTWYFAISAYNAAGGESTLRVVGSKLIP